MAAPIIGVTTYRIETRYGFPALGVAENYIHALSKAGASPILIPNGLQEAQLEELVSRLDGILFTGGGDIHPRFFGGELDEQVNMIDEDRDQVELTLLKNVISLRKPFFGICRGFQLINVGLGGTLYTDVLAQHPGAEKHDYYPDYPRDLLAHPVTISPDSRLNEILGVDLIKVNSLHHQGIKELGRGLTQTATAPDGIPEGLELIDYPFGVAVQWHPEWLQDYAPMQALFNIFVQESKRQVSPLSS